MIYAFLQPEDPIDRGDILAGCPLMFLSRYNIDDIDHAEVEWVPSRVLVLTQTCDLANRKVSSVTTVVVHDAQFLVDQGLLKRDDIRGSIRAGRVFGWYFLPKSERLGLPEMIVNLRQLHTVSLDLLGELCLRGQRGARLLCPYSEHLAKHFADTFSRIGLPEPYETE
jgi:hypothetical protein